MDDKLILLMIQCVITMALEDGYPKDTAMANIRIIMKDYDLVLDSRERLMDIEEKVTDQILDAVNIDLNKDEIPKTIPLTGDRGKLIGHIVDGDRTQYIYQNPITGTTSIDPGKYTLHPNLNHPDE